jgi:hypothetical protein
MQAHMVETTLPGCCWHLDQADDLGSAVVVDFFVVDVVFVVVDGALAFADGDFAVVVVVALVVFVVLGAERLVFAHFIGYLSLQKLTAIEYCFKIGLSSP